MLAETLAGFGSEVVQWESDGFIDGGDILVTDAAVLVGLSERTDRPGFDCLKTTLERWGYDVRAVRTPEGVLHFKSDCCVLDSETILATSRLSGSGCFASFRVLTVPPGEEAAANCVRVNDSLLVPAGYPATAEFLACKGYAVETLAVTQPSLLDGGLSCMSLRWNRGA